MLDSEKTTLLEQPLDMTQIKHRRGAGNRQLAYISGKFAMDQANRIFGYGRWGYKVVSRGHMVIDDPVAGGNVTMYTADVELWVTGADFTFPGAGVGIVTKPYTVDMHEKAYKEAETDAMKRALRHYGDQFGLCLYDGEDYVDAGNGAMIQVKDVPVNGRPQQQAPRPAPTRTNAPTPQAVNKNPSEASDDRKPCTPEQIAGLRQLYQKLGREVSPDISQKSFLAVKRLMEQAVGEYRELRNKKNGRGAPASSENSGSSSKVATQPTSTVNAPSPTDLRKRAISLHVKWDELLIRILKTNVPDDNLTPESRAKLKRALDIIEERQKSAAEMKEAS